MKKNKKKQFKQIWKAAKKCWEILKLLNMVGAIDWLTSLFD